eukprot:jgi/Tetstr1/464245/TSEL_009050.t1
MYPRGALAARCAGRGALAPRCAGRGALAARCAGRASKGSAWKGSSSSNSFAIFKGGLGPRFSECFLRSFMGDKVVLPPVLNAPCERFVALGG